LIELHNMSYKDLWGLYKANISISEEAKNEIKRRRLLSALPPILNSLEPVKLTENQRKIYNMLVSSLPKNTEIILTNMIVKGGWTVYLTGEWEVIKSKIKMIAEQVKQELDEFGNCRVVILPYPKFDGLKVHYDRGLRCPYPEIPD